LNQRTFTGAIGTNQGSNCPGLKLTGNMRQHAAPRLGQVQVVEYQAGGCLMTHDAQPPAQTTNSHSTANGSATNARRFTADSDIREK
jgi:hypothetical protein